MKKTSIIITNQNGLPLLQRCIQSIQKHTDTPYEIIVVDDGSIDGTVDYCRQQKVRFISTPSSRGFSRSCNLGLQLASGDVLMLLNHDIVAAPNWLSNQLHCLYSKEEIGIVGPVINQASTRQKEDMPTISPEHSAETANVPDSRKWYSAQRLDGHCLLIKRELVDRIGLLDDQFSPGHYEIDYCYRARLSDYRLVIAGDTFVYRLDSAGFHKENHLEVQSVVNPNYNKFVQKWGVDPYSFVKREGG